LFSSRLGYDSSMKILHVCTSDAETGAGRAAYRLHRALVDGGHDSHMRVLDRRTGDDRVKGGRPGKGVPAKAAARVRRRWRTYRERGWATTNPVIHSFGHDGAGLLDELNAGDAEILNLHWLGGMLSVADIGRLQKPIVWTFHDMWAFCGGEHYVEDDASARFRHGYLASNRPAGEQGPDLNRRTWEAKRRRWAQQRFTVVCPSHWMAECTSGSALLAGAPVHVIANALDTEDLWRPLPRDAARAALRLPPDKRLVLMGAEGGVTDPRKGGDLLRDMMDRFVLRSPGEVELMIYGQSAPTGLEHWPCPVHWLGTVRDDRVLVAAYSAADAMVVPSRQDNLPNTAVEAQACGVPVVAFDVGGLPDIVTHQVSGWLARPFDVDDLAGGLLWVLQDETRRLALSAAGRDHAVERFAEPVVADQYAGVYARTLVRP
jgi:glycosyltransferase involved in cell wall biosynthesis